MATAPPSGSMPPRPPPPRPRGGGRGLLWLGVGLVAGGTFPPSPIYIPVPIDLLHHSHPRGTSRYITLPPPGSRANYFLAGAYYLYVSGGDAAKARDRAEADARRARDKSLDQAERVGEKIDRAYDDAKARVESGFKSTKANVENEYNKEKKEIGKQVEVLNPHSPHLPFLSLLPPFLRLRPPIFVVSAVVLWNTFRCPRCDLATVSHFMREAAGIVHLAGLVVLAFVCDET